MRGVDEVAGAVVPCPDCEATAAGPSADQLVGDALDERAGVDAGGFEGATGDTCEGHAAVPEPLVPAAGSFDGSTDGR